MSLLKEFWQDDSGGGRDISELGYAIGALVLVGTMIGIGVTVIKNKGFSVMEDLSAFSAQAPATLDTSIATPSTSATITNGNSAPTTVTITN